jgi:hypothetical protein
MQIYKQTLFSFDSVSVVASGWECCCVWLGGVWSSVVFRTVEATKEVLQYELHEKDRMFA